MRIYLRLYELCRQNYRIEFNRPISRSYAAPGPYDDSLSRKKKKSELDKRIKRRVGGRLNWKKKKDEFPLWKYFTAVS